MKKIISALVLASSFLVAMTAMAGMESSSLNPFINQTNTPAERTEREARQAKEIERRTQQEILCQRYPEIYACPSWFN